MSNEIMHVLAKLSEIMSENLPLVKRKLSEAGVSSKNPLIYAVAAYYPALNKLAEEDSPRP